MNAPTCSLCGQAILSAPIPTPQGYRHDRCPSRGLSTGAWIGIGCAAIGLPVLALVLFVTLWQFLTPDAPPPPPPSVETLSLTMESTNHRVRVHYPPSFAASTPNEQDVLLQRRTAGNGVVTVAVDGIEHPISDRLEEVDRVVRLETGKRYPGYVAGPAVASTCSGSPGVSSSGAFDIDGVRYEERACAFMESGTITVVFTSRRRRNCPPSSRSSGASATPSSAPDRHHRATGVAAAVYFLLSRSSSARISSSE